MAKIQIKKNFGCFTVTKKGLVFKRVKPKTIVFTFYFITKEELAHLGHA